MPPRKKTDKSAAGPALPHEPAFAPRPRRAFHTGSHRGGAWKVAYADFVTALMALFIVLWLMSSTQDVKSAVSGYFHDPRGYTQRLGAGPGNAGEGLRVARSGIDDVQKHIEQALRQLPEFERFRDHVKVSVTGEGLRIDLLETEQGLFFVTGSPTPTGAGQGLLGALGAEMGRMPNRLAIEGHTDSRPFRNSGPTSGYTNWELSSDRANAARRLLLTHGLRPGQVAEVRGFADQSPMHAEDPADPRNRRVSVVVKFQVPKP